MIRFSCVQLCATPYPAAHQASPSLEDTGVGCHFLLQCMKVKSESEVTQSCPTLATPWTAAYQAPLSMGFSRQEYWRGVPLPSPKHCIAHSYIKTMLRVLAFTSLEIFLHLTLLLCLQT